MGYKGGQKKISEVAKDLDVGTVLEGSVRKAGDKLRITVQLIDSQTSDHLWAESYDRDLRDVFAIQSDISKTVCEALRVQLLPLEMARIEKKQEVNPEAYALYLKGRFFWNERTQEGVNKAVKYFEQVVRIDPKFAPAYSGLADCYNILADYTWMAPARAGQLTKDYSVKAIQIDDKQAEAHASLALTLTNYFWDFGSAEKELKRAIELRPNYAPAYHWYGVLLFYLRRLGESRSMVARALDLDPYSRVMNMVMANMLAITGDAQEAMRRYEELVELHPDFVALHYWKSQVHSSRSEHDAAIDEAKKAVDLDNSPINGLNLAWVYTVAGKEDESTRILNDWISKARSEYVSPSQIGQVELAMGRRDEGFRWLEKGLEEKDTYLLYFGSLPWLKQYLADPRWKKIDRRLGIVQEGTKAKR
jgi:tetratricopeptide (TPR) repeat protein